MLHALRLREGRASYRNRFVLTPGLRAERRAGRALYGGMAAIRPVDPALVGGDGDPNPIKNTANTNVVRHAGRMFALWEGGPPTEVDASLQTIGPYDFGGRLPHAFTAHPKIDPASGEMLGLPVCRLRARSVLFCHRRGRLVCPRGGAADGCRLHGA